MNYGKKNFFFNFNLKIAGRRLFGIGWICMGMVDGVLRNMIGSLGKNVNRIVFGALAPGVWGGPLEDLQQKELNVTGILRVCWVQRVLKGEACRARASRRRQRVFIGELGRRVQRVFKGGSEANTIFSNVGPSHANYSIGLNEF